MGKGYIRLLIGFHIHTWKYAHTRFLTHVWSIDFWPYAHVESEFKWDLTLLSSLSQCSLGEHAHYVLQWVSSNDAFLEMIFIFSRLCKTAVHHCVYRFLPHVNEQTPLCINRRRMSARERPKTKEKSHWMHKCHVWRAHCGLVVLRSMSFPMHRSHKNTSICILLCGLACITFFCFFYSSEDAKAFESQTDFSRICTFLCISFLHYKMELHIIIPCYCMKQLSITTMFNIFKSDTFCFTFIYFIYFLSLKKRF